jgi:hypothetical protein
LSRSSRRVVAADNRQLFDAGSLRRKHGAEK